MLLKNPVVFNARCRNRRKHRGSKRVGGIHFILGDALQTHLLWELGRIRHDNQRNMIGFASRRNNRLFINRFSLLRFRYPQGRSHLQAWQQQTQTPWSQTTLNQSSSPYFHHKWQGINRSNRATHSLLDQASQHVFIVLLRSTTDDHHTEWSNVILFIVLVEQLCCLHECFCDAFGFAKRDDHIIVIDLSHQVIHDGLFSLLKSLRWSRRGFPTCLIMSSSPSRVCFASSGVLPPSLCVMLSMTVSKINRMGTEGERTFSINWNCCSIHLFSWM